MSKKPLTNKKDNAISSEQIPVEAEKNQPVATENGKPVEAEKKPLIKKRKPLTENQKIINSDISLYKNNNLASNLALLSLVFECLYFLAAYSHNTGAFRPATQFSSGTLSGEYVYTIQFGVSIILNLVILLSVFYASVELKAYNKTFSYVVWVVAVIQIVRIFIYPIRTYNSYYGNFELSRLYEAGELIWLIVCLIASAACLAASGLVGFIRSTNREKFIKQIKNKEVDLEAAYKEEDVPEESATAAKEVPVDA